MFLKLALAATIMAGGATMAQAGQDNGASAPARKAATARVLPYEMSGPVHIRFRNAADLVEALNSADPTVRRAMALQEEARQGKSE